MDVQAAIDALADETKSTVDNLQAILDGTVGLLNKYDQAAVNHALCKFWINAPKISKNDPVLINIWKYLKQLHYIDMFYILGTMIKVKSSPYGIDNVDSLLRLDAETKQDFCYIIIHSLGELMLR
jgi:hypothetical protein